MGIAQQKGCNPSDCPAMLSAPTSITLDAQMVSEASEMVMSSKAPMMLQGITQSCKNELQRLVNEVQSHQCSSQTCHTLLSCFQEKRSAGLNANCAIFVCLPHALAESGQCPNLAAHESEVCKAIAQQKGCNPSDCPAMLSAPTSITLDSRVGFEGHGDSSVGTSVAAWISAAAGAMLGAGLVMAFSRRTMVVQTPLLG